MLGIQIPVLLSTSNAFGLMNSQFFSSVKWDNSIYNIKLLRESNENKAFKIVVDKTFNGLGFFLFYLFLLGRENKIRATFRTINLITVCMINGKT